MCPVSPRKSNRFRVAAQFGEKVKVHVDIVETFRSDSGYRRTERDNRKPRHNERSY